MGTFSNIPSPFTFPFNFPGVPNVVPFATSPGISYIELLDVYRDYLLKIVPEFESTINTIYDEMKKFAAGLEASTGANYDAFVSQINALVATINNRVGPTDVQHLLLTANSTLAIDPTWPNNHVVHFEVRQDSRGGHSLTMPATVSGRIDVDLSPNAVTLFALVPDGKGKWSVDDSYLRNDQVPGIVKPINDELDAIGTDLTSVKDRAASIEELTDTVSFWVAGDAGLTEVDYSVNFTGFVAPFPLRILSIDLVFERFTIAANATNYIALLCRRASGGGSGGYSNFASKTTQSGTGEGITARKTWSMAGGTWTPQYQIFAKGDAVNFAFSIGGVASIKLPVQATIRYMPL